MISLFHGYVLNLEDWKAIKKIKQKHKWGGQLLTILMETPYLDMEIAGGEQSMKFTREDNYLDPFFLTKEQLESKP